MQSYAIAAASGALTAGLTSVLNAATNGAISAGNSATATLPQRITTAFAESAVSTVGSTAAQSAVTGESFNEALKSQAINIVAGAVGNLGAKEIGKAAHGTVTQNADGTYTYTKPSITKAQQLTLHAGLGAVESLIVGNDPLSGAVSGVVGESVGEYLGENTDLSDTALIQIGGLAGGLSAIFTGNLVGLDDSEVADNIYSGQRIGSNAVENNYLLNTGTVEEGDTIESITKELNEFYGTDLTEEEVIQINAIAEEKGISVGDVVKMGSIREDGTIWIAPYGKEGKSLVQNNEEYFKERNRQEIDILDRKRNHFQDSIVDNIKKQCNGDCYNYIIENLGFENKGFAIAHNLSGESLNVDLRGKVGTPFEGVQIIVNSKTGKIVMTPENMGTFDYFSPYYGNYGNHNKYDVNPWIRNGNSVNDSTTVLDRIKAIRSSESGRVGNNKWGEESPERDIIINKEIEVKVLMM